MSTMVSFSVFSYMFVLPDLPRTPETTVITLSDWYHTLARLGARFPYVLNAC